jgi:Beta-lactamase enzyme family
VFGSVVAFGMAACEAGKPRADAVMEAMRRERPQAFESIEGKHRDHRVQIAFAKIVPSLDGSSPTLVRWTYRCGDEYFYPASSVKLFACIAAFEKLAELRASSGNPLVDADSPMHLSPLFAGDASQDGDASNVSGQVITVHHLMRKIMLVSDNEAFNRLYDLVGRDELNARMHAAGLASVSISHRLSDARRIPDQAATAQVRLDTPRGPVTVPARVGTMKLPVAGRDARIGAGVMSGDAVKPGPMDFTHRNGVSLIDLQNAMIMLTRPDINLGLPGFRLEESDRRRMLAAMEEYPRQSRNPIYDDPHLTDEYCKFFLPGLRQWRPGHHIRVLNKVGQAYGFTTDNAYIEDADTGEAFFLAATIYTNDDGIFNDDKYEYTTVAEPFMADLARAVAEHWFPSCS